jgi:hypothetical protein
MILPVHYSGFARILMSFIAFSLQPFTGRSGQALDILTSDGASRSAAIRQAVLESALRRERAAQMRQAVLRMPLGEPDGINVADQMSRARDDER